MLSDALVLIEKQLEQLEKTSPVKTLSLGKKQERFSIMLSGLLLKIYSSGLSVRMGDVFAKDGHIPTSCHYKKLAADLNLFKNGEYLTTTESHQLYGEWWEKYGGSWGGRFRDGNHYSIADGGSK